jgi:hypothetical protein
MSVELECNDTDRETDVLGEKLIPGWFCPLSLAWVQNLHFAAKNCLPARRMTHLLLVTKWRMLFTITIDFFPCGVTGLPSGALPAVWQGNARQIWRVPVK